MNDEEKLLLEEEELCKYENLLGRFLTEEEYERITKSNTEQ
jgi:hypothetical protein